MTPTMVIVGLVVMMALVIGTLLEMLPMTVVVVMVVVMVLTSTGLYT